MKHVTTKAIVLTRVNFGEADRIVTLLTPDQGKVRVIAKGVRKQKSKLAGGLELFSTTDVTYIPGRGEICTLISTRLDKHYGDIVKQIDRTMLGYDFIKRINRHVEDAVGEEFFSLLEQALAGLNDHDIALELVELWFNARLLMISGHSPDLKTDTNGQSLLAEATYNFDVDSMKFIVIEDGLYASNHIRLFRLVQNMSSPAKLKQINGTEDVQVATNSLTKKIIVTHLK